MKKIIYLGTALASLLPITVISCYTVYKPLLKSKTDPNTKALIKYVNKTLNAKPGLKSNLFIPKNGYSIQMINESIVSGFHLPNVFDNYTIYIKCIGILDDVVLFNILLFDQIHQPINTTFEIREFNKHFLKKDSIQTKIEELLINFKTTSTKDLLTYDSLKEIYDVVFTQVKTKMGAKYLPNIKGLIIDEIKSNSLNISVKMVDANENNFTKSLKVTGFPGAINAKRKAKAIVINAYLNTTTKKQDNWSYELLIGTKGFQYITKENQFIKHEEDIHNPGKYILNPNVQLNSFREFLNDVYKEIDDVDIVTGDYVRDFYPLYIKENNLIGKVVIKTYDLI